MASFMLTGVHFLLTYECNFGCDHCFLYCGPHAKGTFTADGIRAVLVEALKIGTVSQVYFEGGEPFLYYPLMLEGVRLAKELGFKVGVVTNAYWATTMEDAELWLRPLLQAGLSSLTVSDDAYHHGTAQPTPAKRALLAAEQLGIAAGSICIEKPTVSMETTQGKGEPVIGGGVMFRGRAVELVEGLPRKPWATFTSCPFEDLREPKRVHVDCYGNVHLCQGLSMGNLWETPFSILVASYDARAHPICGPLLEGGPAALATAYQVPHEPGYVSACHLCYLTRRALLDRFPALLAPRQVYGLA